MNRLAVIVFSLFFLPLFPQFASAEAPVAVTQSINEKQKSVAEKITPKKLVPSNTRLITTLSAPQPLARCGAALKLAERNVKNSKAAAKLIKLLDDPDATVRLCAIKSLGRVQSSRAVPKLIAKLDSTDFREQAYAAISLGYYGRRAKAAEPWLFINSTSTNRYVKGASTAALHEIKGVAARSDLPYEERVMRTILVGKWPGEISPH